MSDPDMATVLEAVEQMVAEVLPEFYPRAMYGGVVMEGEAGVHATRVCGYFAYAAHVSLEFSNGAGFEDPHGHLEGGGKARRHLKLSSVTDLATKEARLFLQQAAER